MDTSRYTKGQQPCSSPKFEPEEWFGVVPHECLGCTDVGKEGTVVFCSNCNRDHHINGWQTCGRTTAATRGKGR